MVNLNWWFIFCASLVSLVICTMLGLTEMLWYLDISRLSYVILVLYFGYSIYVGYMTYRLSKHDKYYGDTNKFRKEQEQDYVIRRLGVSWQTAEILMGLGMAGTIVGFLSMMGKTFASFEASGSQVTQTLLANAATGLSTACITTLIGLACSMILKLQLVNLEFLLPKEES